MKKNLTMLPKSIPVPTKSYLPLFGVRFYIFDRQKEVTLADEKKLKKLLANLEDIVINALKNVDHVHIFNRAEDVSFATLDYTKQLRSEIYMGDSTPTYDKHCIRLIQHGTDVFTLDELIPISKAIKNELCGYLQHDFDAEIFWTYHILNLITTKIYFCPTVCC